MRIPFQSMNTIIDKHNTLYREYLIKLGKQGLAVAGELSGTVMA